MKPVPALAPLSWLYGCAVRCRNFLYDAGILKAARAGVPIIAVGNLTAGGTGKSPLAGELIRRLQRRGVCAGLISRGYGRRSHGPAVVADRSELLLDAARGGDEPVMLARRYPGAPVVVAERRSVAARIAIGLGARMLVMDDGFQHRALGRDLDIVVTDGRRDIRKERLLPAGLRREPLAALRRAGLLVVSKVSSAAEASAAAARLARWYNGPVAGFALEPAGLCDALTGEPAACPAGTPVLVFSGIAANGDVAASARALGLTVAGTREFDDHHAYTAGDAGMLVTELRQTGAQMLVTTEKDAARLNGVPALAETLRTAAPLCCLRMELRFCLGEELLENMLTTLVKGEKPPW